MKPEFGDGGKPSNENADYRLNRPPTGQPWIACDICDFSIPQGEAVKHYKSKKLVCSPCQDEPGHEDYMERRKLQTDENKTSIQPVRD